jgi:hypothetical protein
MRPLITNQDLTPTTLYPETPRCVGRSRSYWAMRPLITNQDLTPTTLFGRLPPWGQSLPAGRRGVKPIPKHG